MSRFADMVSSKVLCCQMTGRTKRAAARADVSCHFSPVSAKQIVDFQNSYERRGLQTVRCPHNEDHVKSLMIVLLGWRRGTTGTLTYVHMEGQRPMNTIQPQITFASLALHAWHSYCNCSLQCTSRTRAQIQQLMSHRMRMSAS